MSKKKMKMPKAFKVFIIILVSLIAVMVLAFVGLRLIYPAILRVSHKIEAPGIDRMETVEIGGIQQALYTRGENPENPVILFLHGGPGNSEMMVLHTFQYQWEKDFTIVQWDQRNAGKTYLMNDFNTVQETLSFDRMVEDAHEVTQYIKQTLGKEKIIIMGHSWGTALGSALVQKYPEDYSAYIGIGQVVGFKDNDQFAYEKVLEAAQTANNQADISALEAIDLFHEDISMPEFLSNLNQIRQIQAKYKLADSTNIGMLLNIFISPYYTTSELLGAVSPKVMLYDQEKLYKEILSKNIGSGSLSKEYTVPVYYIMGENDYQTPYPMAKESFEEISAPDKQFFSIPNAGHMPMLDNKVEFNRVLLEEIRPKIQ